MANEKATTLHLSQLNNSGSESYAESTLKQDRPWIMRTYSGHSTAQASNELYRLNLNKGQTGLSVAFDLPTQTGYDSDEPLALGEVGKVGVPICHIGDMRALFDGLPLDQMNTSMTINATAAWILALYIALAEEQGADLKKLQGTVQNDVIKEYLSRGTYVFPPKPTLQLTRDIITYTTKQMPKWNPVNIGSYHLQEAGATSVQEIAYALCNAIAVLDAVRDSGLLEEEEFLFTVGRISFFVNSGIRFIEEVCKLRAFGQLWDEITHGRYRVENLKFRRFRYGIQVNSLGLTEAQPENNIQRIVLEALGVTLSKNARCRAMQLPTWNEAVGLPRPADQQWSLRIQQVLAYETDILEYEDIFDGSHVIEAKTKEIQDAARDEMHRVLELGGIVHALSHVKERLVASQTERLRRINSGEQTVIGVNKFTETTQSPLYTGESADFLKVDEQVEREQIASLEAFRAKRNQADVDAALVGLRDAASNGENIMPACIRCAHAGATTGEWTQTLRDIFGEFRAPTGIAGAAAARSMNGKVGGELEALRMRVRKTADILGRPLKVLIGKPGLDGHSNGAEQIAVWCRDAGMEVVYEGIRLSPQQIVTSARDEGVHLVGLSILSGSHLRLVPEVMAGLHEEGLDNVRVVVGGIIPEDDAKDLLKAGVARVYTPKDFEMLRLISDMVDVAEAAA